MNRRRPPTPNNDEHFVVEDWPTLTNRLNKVGVNDLPDIGILPRNFDTAAHKDEWIFESTLADVRKLGRQAGLDVRAVGVEKPVIIRENDAATLGVVLLVAWSCLETANKAATLIEFFTRVGSYLSERRQRSAGPEVEVTQEVIVTRDGSSRRIVYRGPASQLPSIVDAMKGAMSADGDRTE
jgi:hypothetical protein